jgi:hypothetical protein
MSAHDPFRGVLPDAGFPAGRKVLLYDNLELTENEVSLLHSIWNKMRNRRLLRKQSY